MVIAVASLLITLTMSLLVTRVAAMALTLTGVSPDVAKFQARSAFCTVGFTTAESEAIANHPVRRQIIMLLMLLGNLQIAAYAASTTLTVIEFKGAADRWVTMAALAGGLVLLLYAANSHWVSDVLNRIIAWSLRHWTKLEVRDYVAVLQLEQGFAVTEMSVHAGDWLADQSLRALRLPDEGVMVLGIQRQGLGYIGAPTADAVILAGDTLIVYGQTERMRDLDERRRDEQGQRAHQEACEAHTELVAELRQSMTLSGFDPIEIEEPFKNRR